MRLEPTKITRNPNALLMQTRHEDKYQLADDIKKDFKTLFFHKRTQL